ncbi:Hypothetical protein RAK1035_2409 [Roseovarius sp. AK1035]|nr:Hypothetical protein RAK1035_2409 [Roseovarius sp. AK1035]
MSVQTLRAFNSVHRVNAAQQIVCRHIEGFCEIAEIVEGRLSRAFLEV